MKQALTLKAFLAFLTRVSRPVLTRVLTGFALPFSPLPRQAADDGQDSKGIVPDLSVRLKKDGRPVDFQQQKVYDWDSSLPMFVDDEILSLDEVTRLIWKVCEDYQVPFINVTDGRGRSRTAAFRWREPEGSNEVLMKHSRTGRWKAVSIACPKFARRTSIVLHEVSHYLTACQFGLAKTSSHGSEFVATMIEVFSRYGTDNIDEAHQARVASYLKTDARSKGIKVADGEISIQQGIDFIAWTERVKPIRTLADAERIISSQTVKLDDFYGDYHPVRDKEQGQDCCPAPSDRLTEGTGNFEPDFVVYAERADLQPKPARVGDGLPEGEADRLIHAGCLVSLGCREDTYDCGPYDDEGQDIHPALQVLPDNDLYVDADTSIRAILEHYGIEVPEATCPCGHNWICSCPVDDGDDACLLDGKRVALPSTEGLMMMPAFRDLPDFGEVPAPVRTFNPEGLPARIFSPTVEGARWVALKQDEGFMTGLHYFDGKAGRLGHMWNTWTTGSYYDIDRLAVECPALLGYDRTLDSKPMPVPSGLSVKAEGKGFKIAFTYTAHEAFNNVAKGNPYASRVADFSYPDRPSADTAVTFLQDLLYPRPVLPLPDDGQDSRPVPFRVDRRRPAWAQDPDRPLASNVGTAEYNRLPVPLGAGLDGPEGLKQGKTGLQPSKQAFIQAHGGLSDEGLALDSLEIGQGKQGLPEGLPERFALSADLTGLLDSLDDGQDRSRPADSPEARFIIEGSPRGFQIMLSYPAFRQVIALKGPVCLTAIALLDAVYPDLEAAKEGLAQVIALLDGPDDGQDNHPDPAPAYPDDADYQKGYKAGFEGKPLGKSVPTAFYQGWQAGRRSKPVAPDNLKRGRTDEALTELFVHLGSIRQADLKAFKHLITGFAWEHIEQAFFNSRAISKILEEEAISRRIQDKQDDGQDERAMPACSDCGETFISYDDIRSVEGLVYTPRGIAELAEEGTYIFGAVYDDDRNPVFRHKACPDNGEEQHPDVDVRQARAEALQCPDCGTGLFVLFSDDVGLCVPCDKGWPLIPVDDGEDACPFGPVNVAPEPDLPGTYAEGYAQGWVDASNKLHLHQRRPEGWAVEYWLGYIDGQTGFKTCLDIKPQMTRLTGLAKFGKPYQNNLLNLLESNITAWMSAYLLHIRPDDGEEQHLDIEGNPAFKQGYKEGFEGHLLDDRSNPFFRLGWYDGRKDMLDKQKEQDDGQDNHSADGLSIAEELYDLLSDLTEQDISQLKLLLEREPLPVVKQVGQSAEHCHKAFIQVMKVREQNRAVQLPGPTPKALEQPPEDKTRLQYQGNAFSRGYLAGYDAGKYPDEALQDTGIDSPYWSGYRLGVRAFKDGEGLSLWYQGYYQAFRDFDEKCVLSVKDMLDTDFHRGYTQGIADTAELGWLTDDGEEEHPADGFPSVLPQVQTSIERDRQARLRYELAGLVPVDQMRERDRTGHGSNARYHQHLKDKEQPCPACVEAHARLTTPYPDAPLTWAEEQWGQL